MYIENAIAIAKILRNIIEVNWLDTNEITYIDSLNILPPEAKGTELQLWEAVALVYLKRGYSPLGAKGEVIRQTLKTLNSNKVDAFVRKLSINWGGSTA